MKKIVLGSETLIELTDEEVAFVDGRLMYSYSGTVKWWNDSKGYGFIDIGDGRDVYAHYTEICMDGFKALKEGQIVTLRVVPGLKGPHAEEIHVVKEGI